MIQVGPSEASSSFAFPDMTALLDVIFILLVFLLLTANVAQKSVDISLPTINDADAYSPLVEEQISIGLLKGEGEWKIDEVTYRSWGAFETSLQEKVSTQKTPAIVIAGDKDAPLEKTLKLFSWLQKHGLSAADVLVASE